jgi:hypothetical protein
MRVALGHVGAHDALAWAVLARACTADTTPSLDALAARTDLRVKAIQNSPRNTRTSTGWPNCTGSRAPS